MSQFIDIWSKRWESLDNRMQALEESLDRFAKSTSDLDRIQTLLPLVKALRVYVTGLYAFFWNGFVDLKYPGDNARNKLTESTEYPKDHVFRAVINQGFEDVAVIEKIINQRFADIVHISLALEQAKTNEVVSNPDDTKPNTQVIDQLQNSLDDALLLQAKLKKADQLAWAALQPAINMNLIPRNTTVITYFHKNASIRLIPYAPVALIGLPFSAVETPKDFLAIPHEVGHYVFRNGRMQNDVTLRSKILEPFTNKIADYAEHWIEEIFADVYGARIGGPVMGLNFQDLQMQAALKFFNSNDGEHPSPVLRPYIYAKVVNFFNSDWAKKLIEIWGKRRKPYNDKYKEIERSKETNNKDYVYKGKLKYDGVRSLVIEDIIDESETIADKQVIDQIINKIVTILKITDTNNSAVENLDLVWQSNSPVWAKLQKIDKPSIIRAELAEEPNSIDELYTHYEKSVNSEIGYKPETVSELTLRELEEFKQEIPKYSLIFDTSSLENVEQLLSDWPKLFFPNHKRSKKDNGEEDQHWWVLDVLYRTAWNTFGNGDWLKGP